MKKDIILFYERSYDPYNLYLIKKEDSKNPNVVVEQRSYTGQAGWTEFLDQFILSYRGVILSSGVEIDRNFKGFIMMYKDTILAKNIIVTDVQKILEIVSS